MRLARVLLVSSVSDRSRVGGAENAVARPRSGAAVNAPGTRRGGQNGRRAASFAWRERSISVVPLLGTILLSAVGSLGLKLAMSVGQKLFGKTNTAESSETFPAQLKRQMDGSTPAPAVSGTVALAQFPTGLRALSARSATEATLPVGAAAAAYRRFEAMWPGRSVGTSPISPHQAP